MKGWILFVGIAGVAVVGLFSVAVGRGSAESRTVVAAVDTATAIVQTDVVRKAETLVEGLSSVSSLKAFQSVELTPKVTARLDSELVSKGQRVVAGQALARLDSRDQEAQVAALKAQVAVSEAGVSQAQAQLADARREYDRYAKLRQSGYATAQQLDSRTTGLHSAQASLKSMEAMVSQAKANLSAAQVKLSEYTLRSPIDGVVLDDYDMAPGVLLGEGTPAFRLANIDQIKAPFSITENRQALVHRGMTVILTLESYPGRRFEGVVTSVDGFVDSKTRTIGAEAIVDNRILGYKLKPGMFAQVLLVQVNEESPLVMPTTALRADGTVLLVKDGRVKMVRPSLGASENGSTAVLSGLDEGDQVVVSGGLTLKDGDAVRLESSTEPG